MVAPKVEYTSKYLRDRHDATLEIEALFKKYFEGRDESTETIKNILHKVYSASRYRYGIENDLLANRQFATSIERDSARCTLGKWVDEYVTLRDLYNEVYFPTSEKRCPEKVREAIRVSFNETVEFIALYLQSIPYRKG